ncbi:MAG: non-ribosomal peptide synthetase [Sandaracinus sp.]|nr:non-ribosomal peptide synthetase [Sandaracinus sp.]
MTTVERGVPFVRAYAEVVARHGARLALEDVTGRRRTHAQLWEDAGHVAERFAALGLGNEDVVALELGRSIELVTGMLGAWRAGAAWTVVEPTLPIARRRRLLEVSNARVRYDESGVHALTTPEPREHDGILEERTLAYVAFTSGSSGTPKGVRIEHRGLLPMLRAQMDAFALDASSRALWVLSPSFDASVSDVGTVMLAGGALVLDAPDVLADPTRLLEVLTRREITSIDLPPSVLSRLPIERLPDTLKTLVLGGEVASVDAVRRAARRHRVVNVYGPTEATVCTSLERCAPTWEGGTLGQPLPHVRYREVEGELWIGGDALARDYAGDPTSTTDRFVVVDGSRWYRTGDRVRREGDAWHFEGRLDRQVKLGGKRAEPEEVEVELARLGVEACVLPRQTDGRTFLVAFVAPRTPGDAPDATLLAAALRQRLPAWLVPSAWCVLDALPRTERNKVDRERLVSLPVKSTSSWPTDPQTRRLAECFAAVLGRDVVGEDDDFFALGGDSLALLSLVARLEAEALPRTASQVHAAPTPRSLAGCTRDPERRTTQTLATLVPTFPRRRGSRRVARPSS